MTHTHTHTHIHTHRQSTLDKYMINSHQPLIGNEHIFRAQKMLWMTFSEDKLSLIIGVNPNVYPPKCFALTAATAIPCNAFSFHPSRYGSHNAFVQSTVAYSAFLLGVKLLWGRPPHWPSLRSSTSFWYAPKKYFPRLSNPSFQQEMSLNALMRSVDWWAYGSSRTSNFCKN